MSIGIQQTVPQSVSKARESAPEGDLKHARYYLGRAGDEADSLVKQIQTAMDADPFDETAVHNLIGRLEELAPKDERVKFWRHAAAKKASLWETAQKVERIKQEIEGLLARAVSLQDRGVEFTLVDGVYKRAVDAASAAQADYPDNDDIVTWLSRATGEYNQFCAQAAILTTLGQTGAFRQVLASLDESQAGSVPVYDHQGKFIGQMTVAEAKCAYTRQANLWVQSKTREKLQDARRALCEQHSPEAAYEILNEFSLLTKGLMPDPEREAIKEFVETEIKPAQRRRETAKQLARAAAGMPQTEFRAAWQRLQRAREVDPHVPGLEEAQKDLRDRLRSWVSAQLEMGSKWLAGRQLEQASQCARMASEASGLEGSMQALLQQAAELDRRIKAVQSQSRDVRDTVQEIEALLSCKGDQESWRLARTKWLTLKERLGEDVVYYPQMDGVGARMDMPLDVAQLIVSIEGALRSSDEAALIDTARACEDASIRYPDQKAILAQCRNRIQARLAFLQAEREFAVGSISKARGLFHIATRGDNRDQAEDYLRKLEQVEREDEPRARCALQRAQTLIRKRPEEAFQLLAGWRQNHWLSSRDEIAGAWHQLVVRWRPKAEQMLRRLLSTESALDVQRVRLLVDALAALESPQAETLRHKALPRCYAQMAENLQELENWAGAVGLWRQAVDEAAMEDGPMYRAKLENAQLQVELGRIDRTDHGDANVHKLRELAAEYPCSLILKRYLAELYLARKESEQARVIAEQGLLLCRDVEANRDHAQAFHLVLDTAKAWKAAPARRAKVRQ